MVARSIAMQLRTRVSLGSLFAASAVVATVLAWHEQRSTAERAVALAPLPAATAPATTQPLATPQQVSPPQAAPAADDTAEQEDEAPGPDAPSATVAPLELWVLPDAYLRKRGADDTAELAQFVEAWAGADSQEPRIEYRKGVVFVRSAQDRGDDGPYPRSANLQGARVCGEASVWLRSALRERLANASVTCDRNVCMYGGEEYAPDGYVVFRPVTVDGETTWALDAWVEIYRASIAPKTAHHNENEVIEALDRQTGTSCAGEPAGAY